MSEPGRFWTFETKALVALSALILAVWIARPAERGGPGSLGFGAPTTFSTVDSGARALRLAVNELGLDGRAWTLPFPEGSDPKEPRCLVVLGPTEAMRPSETSWLRNWVQAGGRLVYALSAWNRDDAFVKQLGFTPALHSGSSAFKQEASSEPARRLLEGTPEQVTGVKTWLEAQSGGAKADAAETLLGGADARIAASLVTIGRGRVLLLSDAAPLTNEWLRTSGAAPLALRAIADFAGGAPVWFDEFHHGFDERAGIERAFFRFLTGSRTGWAFVQIGALALAAVFFAGIRIGRPLSPPAPPRRSSLEHVDALAAAYRAAGAVRRPAAILLEGLRLRFHDRTQEDLARRLEALAQADPSLRGAVRSLVEEPRATRNPSDLVRLAHAVDRILASEKTRAAAG